MVGEYINMPFTVPTENKQGSPAAHMRNQEGFPVSPAPTPLHRAVSKYMATLSMGFSVGLMDSKIIDMPFLLDSSQKSTLDFIGKRAEEQSEYNII